MSVEQAYYFSVALINLVFALAGTRVKEHEGSSNSIQFFMISFFAYFISWFVYVFEVNKTLEIIGALTASTFVWGMVMFGAKRCAVNIPWQLPIGLFTLQCFTQIYTLQQDDLTHYFHVSAAFLPIAFFAIGYMFLKLKVERNPSDIAVGYAYIAMALVVIGRSILLETSPEWFAQSSLYSQIIWPAFCTTIGVFALLSYTEEAQKRVVKESNTDLLTGLNNRRLFDVELSNFLASSPNYGALIFFDLDGFKPINDKYGHNIGDRVLIELGIRLKKSVPSNQILARLGGDEFALLLTDIGDVQSEARRQAKKIAQRMQKVIKTPIRFGEYTIQVTSSIGIHIITPGSQNEVLILTEADNAMYQSKAIKKGSITFSDDLAKSGYLTAKIGVSDIDQEHEELDGLIHSLLNSKTITPENIRSLKRGLKRHFNSEEKLSSELELNMTAEHIQDHHKILTLFSDIDTKSDSYLTTEFVTMLSERVSQHTVEHDQLLCRVPQTP
ncbi:diguanylate cyclase domain-containing protein [Aliivibrio kagoshimensis]|uniref:diguanylate cyclase domain-containing protein n=1 Tax=Aliivibrio kagoshimensis TaxID=2910230 RepID=UPI003D0E577C